KAPVANDGLDLGDKLAHKLSTTPASTSRVNRASHTGAATVTTEPVVISDVRVQDDSSTLSASGTAVATDGNALAGECCDSCDEECCDSCGQRRCCGDLLRKCLDKCHCCCGNQAQSYFNCGCNGSYKFPVPPLYTYHWPGMYSAELMTDYHSPWRFPPLKPYTDEAAPQSMGVDDSVLTRIRPVSATVAAPVREQSSFRRPLEL